MAIKCIFLIINHNITVGKFEATEGSHQPDELTDQNGYWSGLLFPSPGDHPDPGIKPASLVSLS